MIVLQMLGVWYIAVNTLGALLVLSGNADSQEDNKESEVFKWLIIPGVQLAIFIRDRSYHN